MTVLALCPRRDPCVLQGDRLQANPCALEVVTGVSPPRPRGRPRQLAYDEPGDGAEPAAAVATPSPAVAAVLLTGALLRDDGEEASRHRRLNRKRQRAPDEAEDGSPQLKARLKSVERELSALKVRHQHLLRLLKTGGQGAWQNMRKHFGVGLTVPEGVFRVTVSAGPRSAPHIRLNAVPDAAALHVMAQLGLSVEQWNYLRMTVALSTVLPPYTRMAKTVKDLKDQFSMSELRIPFEHTSVVNAVAGGTAAESNATVSSSSEVHIAVSRTGMVPHWRLEMARHNGAQLDRIIPSRRSQLEEEEFRFCTSMAQPCSCLLLAGSPQVGIAGHGRDGS